MCVLPTKSVSNNTGSSCNHCANNPVSTKFCVYCGSCKVQPKAVTPTKCKTADGSALAACRQCTSCAKMLKPGTKFCNWCGTKVTLSKPIVNLKPKGKRCRSCLVNLEFTAKFCHSCGCKAGAQINSMIVNEEPRVIANEEPRAIATSQVEQTQPRAETSTAPPTIIPAPGAQALTQTPVQPEIIIDVTENSATPSKATFVHAISEPAEVNETIEQKRQRLEEIRKERLRLKKEKQQQRAVKEAFLSVQAPPPPPQPKNESPRQQDAVLHLREETKTDTEEERLAASPSNAQSKQPESPNSLTSAVNPIQTPQRICPALTASTLLAPTTSKSKKSSRRASQRVQAIQGLAAMWAKKQARAEEEMKSNVFSRNYEGDATRPKKGDEGYGTAPEGSKSAGRSLQAQNWVKEKVRELIEVIKRVSNGVTNEGCCTVDFKTLFIAYETISDTLVGMLQRAKKYGLLVFQGEMLFQGQDDKTVIKLTPGADHYGQY